MKLASFIRINKAVFGNAKFLALIADIRVGSEFPTAVS